MNNALKTVLYSAALLTLTGCGSMTREINSYLRGDQIFLSYEEGSSLAGSNTIEITRLNQPWPIRPFSVVVSTINKDKFARQSSDYFIRDITFKNNKAVIPVPLKKGYQLESVGAFDYFSVSADIGVQQSNSYCYNFRATTINVNESYIRKADRELNSTEFDSRLTITPKLSFLPPGTGFTCTKEDRISSGSGGHS